MNPELVKAIGQPIGIVVGAILAAILGFLFNRAMEHRKLHLRREEIKFTKYHDRFMEAADKININLNALLKSIRAFEASLDVCLQIGSDEDAAVESACSILEKIQARMHRIDELTVKHEIFMPPELVALVEEMSGEFHEIFWSFVEAETYCDPAAFAEYVDWRRKGGSFDIMLGYKAKYEILSRKLLVGEDAYPRPKKERRYSFSQITPPRPPSVPPANTDSDLKRQPMARVSTTPTRAIDDGSGTGTTLP